MPCGILVRAEASTRQRAQSTRVLTEYAEKKLLSVYRSQTILLYIIKLYAGRSSRPFVFIQTYIYILNSFERKEFVIRDFKRDIASKSITDQGGAIEYSRGQLTTKITLSGSSLIPSLSAPCFSTVKGIALQDRVWKS